jgi:hypothetical protein
MTVAGGRSLAGDHLRRNVASSIRRAVTPSVATGLTGSGGDGRDTATAPKTTSGMMASAIAAVCLESNAGSGDFPEGLLG